MQSNAQAQFTGIAAQLEAKLIAQGVHFVQANTRKPCHTYVVILASFGKPAYSNVAITAMFMKAMLVRGVIL